MMLNDFIVQDHGTLVGFVPTSATGKKWWQDHVEDCTKMGAVFLVERRYARLIISGIEHDLED
tara:strand:+ start:83 stop:271 length:189 start_codon:yes stop_codon:yes gene_type:complete